MLSRLAAEPQGYAECYLSLWEIVDAIDDSDGEVDYTELDSGDKKCSLPVLSNEIICDASNLKHRSLEGWGMTV